MRDLHVAMSECFDSIRFLGGYPVARLRPVDRPADFRREDKLPFFLWRIHAAIIGAGVLCIAKVPSFDMARVRNEMKRRSQTRKIFCSLALIDANFPTEITGFEGETNRLPKERANF